MFSPCPKRVQTTILRKRKYLIYDMKSLRPPNSVSEELEDFASAVGHEIRNPLGGIKGFALLLEKKLEDRPDLQSMIANILKGVDQIDGVLKKIADASKPAELSLISENLADIVLEAINCASPSRPVYFETMDERKEAVVDRDKIKWTVAELIKNADEAAGQEGSISLRLTSEDDTIAIEVKDTGAGIPKHLEKRVFSPFFSTKPAREGFGLTECRKIIRTHNGSITFHSDEGKGTSVLIRLPRTYES